MIEILLQVLCLVFVVVTFVTVWSAMVLGARFDEATDQLERQINQENSERE